MIRGYRSNFKLNKGKNINIIRDILHTFPEIFHIIPEIFHIIPEIFYIIPEFFRIVPSQFLQFSDPRNGRDGFYAFYGSIFGYWRGIIDIRIYEIIIEPEKL